MLTNSQGFKRFFELYFEPVYRFVRKYTEEDAIARDITQDTFIRLYERRRDFDVPEKAKSFIYITARNLCLDHLKHQKIKQQYQQTQSVSEAKDPDFFTWNHLSGNFADSPSSYRYSSPSNPKNHFIGSERKKQQWNCRNTEHFGQHGKIPEKKCLHQFEGATERSHALPAFLINRLNNKRRLYASLQPIGNQ